MQPKKMTRMGQLAKFLILKQSLKSILLAVSAEAISQWVGDAEDSESTGANFNAALGLKKTQPDNMETFKFV